jgi:hypothetical protein
MVKVIKAPKGYSYDPYSKFILLAGQFPEKIIAEFNGVENLYFLDPTGSTLDWKLIAQSRVDLILFFFKEGDNTSTFLELGIATGMTDSIIILCQNNFSQYDLLKPVCDRYSIPIHFNYNEMVDNIKKEVDLL